LKLRSIALIQNIGKLHFALSVSHTTRDQGYGGEIAINILTFQ